MQREIKLDGGEISILKAVGFSGSAVNGRMLIERAGEMETAELLDTLDGLISLGYVVSSKVNIRTLEDLERAAFRVNPSYARDLRDALKPAGRRRREERTGRQRERRGR